MITATNSMNYEELYLIFGNIKQNIYYMLLFANLYLTTGIFIK